MREFNYGKYKDYKWDSEILGLMVLLEPKESGEGT